MGTMTNEDRAQKLADMTLEDKINEVLLIMWQCQDALEALSQNPMMRAMGAKFAGK